MKTRDFLYTLPEQLIAQKPCDIRSQSRLLHYSRTDQSIEHLLFNNIIDLIEADDLLVFNNTRVIPARIYGYKATGDTNTFEDFPGTQVRTFSVER